eukprot:4149398-Pyramimonas_sp.AAC.1
MSSAPGVARQVADRVKQHGFKACTVLEILGMEGRDGVKVQYAAIRYRMTKLTQVQAHGRHDKDRSRHSSAIDWSSDPLRRAGDRSISLHRALHDQD